MTMWTQETIRYTRKRTRPSSTAMCQWLPAISKEWKVQTWWDFVTYYKFYAFVIKADWPSEMTSMLNTWFRRPYTLSIHGYRSMYECLVIPAITRPSNTHKILSSADGSVKKTRWATHLKSLAEYTCLTANFRHIECPRVQIHKAPKFEKYLATSSTIPTCRSMPFEETSSSSVGEHVLTLQHHTLLKVRLKQNWTHYP